MTPNAATPGCSVRESFDPLSPEFLANPYAVMTALDLDGAPVFFAPSIGYYVITRYADIEEVFKDPGTYSAAVAQAPLVPLVPEAQQILVGGHKPQLARRYPQLRLAPDQELTFHPNISFRGPQVLRVRTH